MELVCASALVMVIVLAIYLCMGCAPVEPATLEGVERVRLVRVRPYAPSTPDPRPSVTVQTRRVRGKGSADLGSGPKPPPLQTRRSVQREILPLYQEKGWRKDSRTYRGFYRACGRQYPGEIQEHHRGLYQVYIFNPPVQQLKRHPHGPCFIPQADGRFKVHLAHTPRDVDHVIVSVETILREALGSR